eukprot:TRINITY_DN1369_c0_g2_i1.p1 TRINITY_DN1369_c0_g2~~TRINITY_DN1369_c0_g2_i1.p1  ORF type:complete len:267 (+),score=80.94 TRINITY_DN1369_c0_g2_i1:209-1009(+)
MMKKRPGIEVTRTIIVEGEPVLVVRDKETEEEKCYDSQSGKKLPIEVPSKGVRSVLADILNFTEDLSGIEESTRSVEAEVQDLCSQVTQLMNEILFIAPNMAWQGSISELTVRTKVASLRLPSRGVVETREGTFASMFQFAFQKRRSAKVMLEQTQQRKREAQELLDTLTDMNEEALFCAELEGGSDETTSDDATEKREEEEEDQCVELIEQDDIQQQNSDRAQTDTTDDDDTDTSIDFDGMVEEEALVDFLTTPAPPVDLSDLDY